MAPNFRNFRRSTSGGTPKSEGTGQPQATGKSKDKLLEMPGLPRVWLPPQLPNHVDLRSTSWVSGNEQDKIGPQTKYLMKAYGFTFDGQPAVTPEKRRTRFQERREFAARIAAHHMAELPTLEFPQEESTADSTIEGPYRLSACRTMTPEVDLSDRSEHAKEEAQGTPSSMKDKVILRATMLNHDGDGAESHTEDSKRTLKLKGLTPSTSEPETLQPADDSYCALADVLQDMELDADDNTEDSQSVEEENAALGPMAEMRQDLEELIGDDVDMDDEKYHARASSMDLMSMTVHYEIEEDDDCSAVVPAVRHAAPIIPKSTPAAKPQPKVKRELESIPRKIYNLSHKTRAWPARYFKTDLDDVAEEDEDDDAGAVQNVMEEEYVTEEEDYTTEEEDYITEEEEFVTSEEDYSSEEDDDWMDDDDSEEYEEKTVEEMIAETLEDKPSRAHRRCIGVPYKTQMYPSRNFKQKLDDVVEEDAREIAIEEAKGDPWVIVDEPQPVYTLHSSPKSSDMSRETTNSVSRDAKTRTASRSSIPQVTSNELKTRRISGGAIARQMFNKAKAQMMKAKTVPTLSTTVPKRSMIPRLKALAKLQSTAPKSTPHARATAGNKAPNDFRGPTTQRFVTKASSSAHPAKKQPWRF